MLADKVDRWPSRNSARIDSSELWSFSAPASAGTSRDARGQSYLGTGQPMEAAQLLMLVIFSKPAISESNSPSTTAFALPTTTAKPIAMGVWDVISDLVEAAAPWSTAEAEAPPAEDKDNTESQDDSKAEEDGEEEEEEEEDDDEPEDQKEKLEEECKNSKQCAPAKHHFDECVERVTNASDDDEDEKEDCVEEFFHLAHCATQCAAPKLWSVLK